MGRLKVPQSCSRCGTLFYPWKPKKGKPRLFCSVQCRETPAIERFWAKVQVSDGCWKWIGRTDKDGYGEFIPQMAHRFSWEMHNGPVPNNLCVLHHCDNPPCTNPKHLYIGTNADNARDRKERGRQRGELHGRAIVTEAQVREIRSRYATEKISQTALSSEYGLSQTSVSQIVLKKCWKHID